MNNEILETRWRKQKIQTRRESIYVCYMYTADIAEKGKSISKKKKNRNEQSTGWRKEQRMKGCAVTGWGGDAETKGKKDPLVYICTTSKYVRIR